MTDKFLVVAKCECHQWIISSLDPKGPCRRCGMHPEVERVATPADITICFHDGSCGPR